MTAVPQQAKESRWAGVSEIMAMSGPIILGLLSFTIMMFVDRVMVSKLGSEAFAAVGSSGLWSFIFTMTIMGTSQCVGTFASQCLGRGEKQNCARYAWQGVYLSFLAGLIALVLWPLSGPLFRSMGHEETVTHFEIIYFQIRLVGYLFVAWQVSLAGFFQSIRKSWIPMASGVFANGLNILLDYLLIFGEWGFPKWGVAGASVATVIALAVQSILLHLVFISKPFNREFGTRAAWPFDKQKFMELMRIGLPSGISSFLNVAFWGIFTSYIMGYFGTIALAANGAAITFLRLSFLPVIGLSHGIAAVGGRWIGQKNTAMAKARTYTSIRIGIAYMFCMGLFMALFGDDLIRFCFSDDPEVIGLGHKILILMALYQPFDAINIVTSGALRGAGDTRWMAYTTVGGQYLFFLPLALILALATPLGPRGPWIAAVCYITPLSAVLFTRFHGEYWSHIKIFDADKS
jgi:MATE family multidrug resistance protein